jgi:Rps23 Pro-64 3,4-dihydroxylase Tpa1-like proline 4-hydroxylase
MFDQEVITKNLLQTLEESRQSIETQWSCPTGTPTRHFVVDNLLAPEICEAIYSAFPAAGEGFRRRWSFRERKKTSAHIESFDEILAKITYSFQDKRVVKVVSLLTGLGGIEPDPSLYAGGLSMMFRGDYLNPHIDNSHDMARKKYRRLNLLYYVSPDWVADNGGNFELWDSERKSPKTIVSSGNRLIVMETNKESWHSVSPVQVDRPRCCVSNYYFSNESPDRSSYFHVTSFSGRPGERVKKMAGALDNFVRNVGGKFFHLGRGKSLANTARDSSRR